LIAASRSYQPCREILTKDEDQIVRTMALTVLFARNGLDALAVSNKCIGQTGTSAVTGTPIPQCLMADLAEDVVAAVSHPEVHTLEPGEFELLVIPDQRHGGLLLPIMGAVSVSIDGRDWVLPVAAMCTEDQADATARLLPNSSKLKRVA
jgi:hypothetical protein